MPATAAHPNGVLVRMARDDDDNDLVRLAALEGTPALAGPALVAEEDGAIVAALCLSSGRAVANPFVRALHLVDLLRSLSHQGMNGWSSS